MHRKTLSIMAAVSILTVNPTKIEAGMLESAKSYASSANPFKKDDLFDASFKNLYPKSFFKKSYFGYIAVGTSIAVAGTILFVTAGTGAPVAAAGVSSVATAIAGGGQGAYLAGLAVLGSSVASMFGTTGGMVLGAAILNGIVIGATGGAALTIAQLSALEKSEVSTLMTAMSLDGVVFYIDPETKTEKFMVRVKTPRESGSKEIQNLIEKIYNEDEDISKALEEKDEISFKSHTSAKKAYQEKAIKLLETKLETGKFLNEDIIVLSTIAWQEQKNELFIKAINAIDIKKLKKKSFYYYLKALSDLLTKNNTDAISLLRKSLNEESYALEPVVLLINILGNEDFNENEQDILALAKHAEENFDSDKYSTMLNMTSIYYRVASLYYVNEKYAKAEEFYRKALDELGFFKKKFFGKDLKHTIQIAIANSMYKNGKILQADKLYAKIINEIDEKDTQKILKLKNEYLGTKK